MSVEIPTSDNDNQNALRIDSDGRGQAALLLVESLIHGLTEGAVLSTVEAVDIIEMAADVQSDLLEEFDVPPTGMMHAYAMLSFMSQSFRNDLPR